MMLVELVNAFLFSFFSLVCISQSCNKKEKNVQRIKRKTRKK
jgi:hypothetical protein